MIEVVGPDGAVHQFPSGTSEDVIRRVMGERYPAQPERTLRDRIVDNVIGRDDGVMSFGEKLATALNMGGESMTLGLVGDEAAAATDSLIGRGTYDERLGQYRANEDQFRQENPALALTSEIAPAFLPGLGIASAAARPATTLGRLVTGGLLGATAGATQGFMEGEGGLGSRVNNALLPMAAGGILGVAMEPLAQGAGAVWRSVGPGVSAAARQAQQRLGLNETAARIVGDAVERDAPYAADNLAEAGPRAVNAQMGVNTQGLLDWIANRPGSAAAYVGNQVESMAESAGQRFSGVLDTVLGRPEGVRRAQANIMRNTADERRDAYGAAYDQIIDFASPQGQQIEDLLSRVPEDVIRRAERLMRAEGERSAQIKFTINDDGTVALSSMPDVRTIDYITRALRDMGDFGTGEGKQTGGAFVRLAGQMRSTLDEIVPEYGAARAAGRDAIVNREAVQFGGDLFRQKIPMDVAEDVIASMGDAELRYARQGLRSYIDQIMANVKPALRDQNMDAREALAPLRQILSRDGKTKLTALLGEEGAVALIDEAQQAYSVLSLRAGIVRGSPTAPRMIAEQTLEERIPRTFGEALEGGSGLLGATNAALRPLIDSSAFARAMRKDEVTNAIGQALMLPANAMPGNLALMQQLAPALRAGDQAAGRVVQNARGLLAGLSIPGMGLLAEPN